MKISIVLIILVVLLVGWILGAYNKLIRLNVSCDEAFSTMDIYLKQRFDLIPNLVATVKEFASHEADTLEKVIQTRNSNTTSSPQQRMAEEGAITQSLRQIFALSESYPDLKSNQNFVQLADQLKNVEKDIANARKYYNGTIRQHNTAILTIPANFIAGIAAFQSRPMFEVDSVAERQNVKVEF